MKIRLSYIIVILTLLFAAEGYSQVNRTVGRNQYRRSIVKNKEKDKKADFVSDALAYLTKELKLDSFQEAAMREIILQYKDAASALMEAKNMMVQERREKAFALSMKIYDEAVPLLSKEQVEKYKQILKIEKEEEEETPE